MKRLGVMLLSFALIGFLTGCGNTKTLTCTQATEEGVEAKMIFNFKNEEIVSGEQTIKMTLPEESNFSLEEIKEILDESVESFRNVEGIEINSQDNGENEAEITVSYDYNKLTDDSKAEFGIAEVTSYEDIKSEFEELEFVCE